MRVATQNAATDPRTGTIDMDMIATGQGASDRLERGWVFFFFVKCLLLVCLSSLSLTPILFRSFGPACVSWWYTQR